MSTNMAQGQMHCFLMVKILGLEKEAIHSSAEEICAELV